MIWFIVLADFAFMIDYQILYDELREKAKVDLCV